MLVKMPAKAQRARARDKSSKFEGALVKCEDNESGPNSADSQKAWKGKTAKNKFATDSRAAQDTAYLKYESDVVAEVELGEAAPSAASGEDR